ncbi:MAG: GFA family protein, partial [Luminiphilus sp.]|nr:GFA family protein [Luminiphilus sp.]
MAIISGACFCKAVKYELLRESQMQGLCFCTDCQRVGGSAHWTSYAVAPADFRLLEGKLTPYTYDPGSGREVTRHFCGTCGTQIMVQSDELGVASVNAMTFDD